jgi:hypothetical protein
LEQPASQASVAVPLPALRAWEQPEWEALQKPAEVVAAPQRQGQQSALPGSLQAPPSPYRPRSCV